MFNVDFSLKTVLIAVSTIEKNGKYEGIIYNPTKVFAKINARSEDHYKEFFHLEQKFKLISLETEMGPGELRNELGGKGFCDGHYSIGGIIALITTTNYLGLVNHLEKCSEDYKESKEKTWCAP